MSLETTAAAALAAFLAVTDTVPAAAGPAYATAPLNLRSGPGISYGRIATIPPGAAIDVTDCGGMVPRDLGRPRRLGVRPLCRLQRRGHPQPPARPPDSGSAVGCRPDRAAG
jgi:hypothetical protein